MASTANNNAILVLNARVTYALSIYCQTLGELGTKGAYDQACSLAGLTLADRAQFRNAVGAQR